MAKANASNKKYSRRQLFVFKTVALTIPFVVLLIFELLLRIASYGDDYRLFIPNSTEGYAKYMMVNPEVGRKYFQKLEYTQPANDIFLKDKPENGFRLFVLGSSTVFGFPYERNLMFSRILHQQLEETLPGKKIEVINTAITAINSFTLLDFTDQILNYEPDAVLIYAGHNEFYGAFGTGSNETMTRNRGLARLHLALLDFKIYQLLRNTFSGIAGSINAEREKETSGTLMKRMAARKEIEYGSDAYTLTMDRYRQNMGDLLEKFRNKAVPVFLSELVSNISGMEPFSDLSSGSTEDAMEVFRMARAAEAGSDFEKAQELYVRAKDLDAIRFRASEDVNQIVHELADEYGAYKVPMLNWFRENSPGQLIGNTLMTEHVHPNIEGNFIMAEAFYTALVKSGVLGQEENKATFKRQFVKRNYGYTALDSLLGHHRVQLLKGFWPFVREGEQEKNYKLTYKPQSFIDSLAFSALVYSDRSLADVRLDLAKLYEKNNLLVEAYREYEALLRTNPYIAVNYRDASSCLLQLGNLPLALRYFQKSLEYEESFFATFRIGEIFLLKGDYKNAVANFEKAFALAPDDKKVNVLAKSYVAFVYAGQKDRAEAAAAELKRVNASQFLKIPPKRYVYNQYIPFQTRNQVLEAKELMSSGDFDKALLLLQRSLDVYDSHVARKLIGEIYFRQNRMAEALENYNRVYDEFRFDPEFLHQLTLGYLRNQEMQKAAKYFDELRNLEPDYKYLNLLSALLPQ